MLRDAILEARMESDSLTKQHFPRDEEGNLVSHVPGLEYYPNFLSLEEQRELLELIDSNPWQEGVIARRQQFYGEVYYHTSFKSKVLQGCDGKSDNDKKSEEEIDEVSFHEKTFDWEKKIHDVGSESNAHPDDHDGGEIESSNKGIGICMVESGMTKWLEKTMPFFVEEGLMEPPSQVLINEYKNNMGIASHFEDFDAFGPVIVTISLVSPVYMTLKKPSIMPRGSDTSENINACDIYDDIIKILLEPGSLLIMKDDARFKYRHGIGKYKWVNIAPLRSQQHSLSPSTDTQFQNSSTACIKIKRDDSYRRVSLTIRHLLSTRRQVQEHEDESDTIKDPSVY